MDIQSTTSRLRRTFAYPSDDNRERDGESSTSSDAALDEQEQEDLIASLAAQNAARNAQFRLFLLALPVCSALPYLLALFRGGGSSSGSSSPLVAVLSLSSLASTTWMLYALPPDVTGIPRLDAWIAGGGGNAMGRNSARFALKQQQGSPLELYLPYLNMGLCAILVFTGFMNKSGAAAAAAGQWGHVGLGNLPAIVYAVVLVAKMVMGGVDPERELSGLRYGYKGA